VACRSLNHLVRQSVRPQIETGRGVFYHWALRAGATTSCWIEVPLFVAATVADEE